MKKSKELFDYNKQHEYGKALNDNMTMNLFSYCARHLEKDEEGSVAFLGVLYFQPSAQITQWYGVVLTQRRLLVGLNSLFSREFVAFPLDEFTALSFNDNSRLATITFHHPKKDIHIGVLKHRVDDIIDDILTNSKLPLIQSHATKK